MKVSRAQMAEHRLRILESASRLFRENGFDAVSVKDIMNAAGLTHGGFYGHLKSKDDLIAQSLAYSLTVTAETEFELVAYIESYLSRQHCDNPGTGCPTASLVAGVRHQGRAARAVTTEGFRAQVDRLSRALPGSDNTAKRRTAIGRWATMVGAVILARAVNDPALSNEILEQTRAWIECSGERLSITGASAS